LENLTDTGWKTREGQRNSRKNYMESSRILTEAMVKRGDTVEREDRIKREDTFERGKTRSREKKRSRRERRSRGRHGRGGDTVEDETRSRRRHGRKKKHSRKRR